MKTKTCRKGLHVYNVGDGCKKCENRNRNLRRKRRGLSEYQRLRRQRKTQHKAQTLPRLRVRAIRRSARSRNHLWELPEDLAQDLVNGRCHYCGYKSEILNGIDRVDSSVGYTPENSVSCCGFCNRAKREFPVERFLNWINHVRSGVGEPGKSSRWGIWG